MENSTQPTFFMQNRRIIYIAIGVLLILMIPLIAMQFTNEVNWGVGDFIFMGILLFGSGITYEFISRKANNWTYRTAIGIAVGFSLFLIWVNAAVGILGDEGNSITMLYVLIPAIGLFGGFIVGFKPRRMSFVLFTMASVQAIIPLIALIANPDVLSEPPGMLGAFLLNGFFVVMFVVSALLFQRSTIKTENSN